jgi:hypothetical protein
LIGLGRRLRGERDVEQLRVLCLLGDRLAGCSEVLEVEGYSFLGSIDALLNRLTLPDAG